MRILIATDAWHPQVNGVVRTLTSLARSAKTLGVTIEFLSPEGFPSVRVPTYPGLRLALPSRREIARRIEQARPDAIHIATEGTIGFMARAWCRKHGKPFTTSYTTRFPEYISARWPVPEGWIYAALAAVPRRRGRDHGGDAVADDRAQPARIHKSRHVDPRRRHRAVQPRLAPSTSTCRARSSSASDGSRSRRTSKRFFRSICRAPRS